MHASFLEHQKALESEVISSLTSKWSNHHISEKSPLKQRQWHTDADDMINKIVAEQDSNEACDAVYSLLLCRLITYKGVASPPTAEDLKKALGYLSSRGKSRHIVDLMRFYMRANTLSVPYYEALSLSIEHYVTAFKNKKEPLELVEFMEISRLSKEFKRFPKLRKNLRLLNEVRVSQSLGILNEQSMDYSFVLDQEVRGIKEVYDLYEILIQQKTLPCDITRSIYALGYLARRMLIPIHLLMTDDQYKPTGFIATTSYIHVDSQNRAYSNVDSDKGYRIMLINACVNDVAVSTLAALHNLRSEIDGPIQIVLPGLFNDFEVEGITRALDHYYEGFYEECILLISTRIESMLRRRLYIADVQDHIKVKTDDDSLLGEEFNLGTLNDILNLFKRRLCSDNPNAMIVIDYAKYLLTQREGWNIRNTVMHGLHESYGTPPRLALPASACLHLVLQMDCVLGELLSTRDSS